MRQAHLDHRALAMTIYAAGLRISEVSRLRIIDIDIDIDGQPARAAPFVRHADARSRRQQPRGAGQPHPVRVRLEIPLPALYGFSGKIKTVSASNLPSLEPGRVYRTRDLGQWSANPPRLARRLVREGRLVQLAHGLFAHLKRGRFGLVPPTDDELLRAFVDGGPFVFTGSDRWNALGLGTTAVFAKPLVYNTKRSGLFDFGGRQFLLRRVAFPVDPLPEWFVVDLFENAKQAGAAPGELAVALTAALRTGKFDREQLLLMARRYGSRRTQLLVRSALEASAA